MFILLGKLPSAVSMYWNYYQPLMILGSQTWQRCKY